MTGSWRMDKTSPRWKNVPTPMRNTQVTLLGTCFQMLDNGNLCVNIDSVALPSATPQAGALPGPVREMSASNRRKFAARAPSRATGNPPVRASGSGSSSVEPPLNSYAVSPCLSLASYTKK